MSVGVKSLDHIQLLTLTCTTLVLSLLQVIFLKKLNKEVQGLL